MRLELVPIPSSDVDRAKEFYVDRVGFHEDHDVRPADGIRVLQLTPPGSACSILLSTGLYSLEKQKPGSLQGLHLVVDDLAAAREALIARGVEMDIITDMGGILYAGFSDPDGNTWTLQQITTRAGRPDAEPAPGEG
jgi:catechol 2,3-dioxygenase-like lactoylglutathione lyase family enzyme